MATTTATDIKAIPLGYNQENWELFQAAVAASAAADSIAVTVPTRWIGQGFTVVSARCEQFVQATASGARTKTNVPVTVTSVDEATGIVTLLIGATAITATAGRVLLLLAPSN